MKNADILGISYSQRHIMWYHVGVSEKFRYSHNCHSRRGKIMIDQIWPVDFWGTLFSDKPMYSNGDMMMNHDKPWDFGDTPRYPILGQILNVLNNHKLEMCVFPTSCLWTIHFVQVCWFGKNLPEKHISLEHRWRLSVAPCRCINKVSLSLYPFQSAWFLHSQACLVKKKMGTHWTDFARGRLLLNYSMAR